MTAASSLSSIRLRIQQILLHKDIPSVFLLFPQKLGQFSQSNVNFMAAANAFADVKFFSFAKAQIHPKVRVPRGPVSLHEVGFAVFKNWAANFDHQRA